MKSLKIVDRIEIWPIDRLSASVKRSRKHRAQQSTQIAASRLEFGDVHPFWSTRMKPDCWQGGILAAHSSVCLTCQLALDHVTEAGTRTPTCRQQGWGTC